jgi:rhodanese-related sulfurtransferase
MPPDPDDLDAIRDTAATRAQQAGAPMAGLLLPAEAWALHKAGVLDIVDTRTLAERDLIGYVPGSLPIEWYDYPAKKRNEAFLDQLQARVPADRPVAFLCRSGVRSHHAAALATANGYEAAYNILEGFEGDRNAHGQRVIAGWRVAGLPWRQD